MTRMFPTLVGLTLLALAPVRTAAQVAGSLDEAVRPGRFMQGSAMLRAGLLRPGDAHCVSNIRSQQVRVSEPSSKESAIGPVRRGCERHGVGGGFFGAGVTASPLPNLALLGDGHLVGGSDGIVAFYGSGTAALRGVIPGNNSEEIAGVAGVGLGLFVDDGYVAAGPQFVFGLEGKAGFGQIRVLRFPNGAGAFALLGGFRF